MSSKMENTSEIAEGGCIDACACIDCIVHVAREIDEKIRGMDTAELSRGAFLIKSSSVFRRVGELTHEERICGMDKIYIQGIDVISELLMKRDRAVGFVLLDGIILTDDESMGLVTNWKKFFYLMIAERKGIHFGKGYNLRLSIRVVDSICSFILEKIQVNTDI